MRFEAQCIANDVCGYRVSAALSPVKSFRSVSCPSPLPAKYYCYWTLESRADIWSTGDPKILGLWAQIEAGLIQNLQ